MSTTEKQIVKVSVPELVNVLRTIKLNRWVSVTTDTEPRMNKTGNPFYNKETKKFNVRKVTTTEYRLSKYEDRVNNNMEKEGMERTFESQKPTGRSHVEGTECLLVSDKDPNVFYFMIECVGNNKPRTEYFKDGQPMNETDILIMNDFLIKSGEITSQEQEKKVKVITPLVSNIKRLVTEHVEYIVE